MVLATVALAGTTIAGPAAGPERIQWQAPAGCPDVEAVRTHLEDLTGDPVELDFDVVGSVETSEAGYRLRLTVDLATQFGERTLEATDCGLLARAAALIIALELDPIATADRHLNPVHPTAHEPVTPTTPTQRPAAGAEASVPQPSQPAERSPRPDPDLRARQPPVPPRRKGIEASLSAGVAFSLTPRTTGGVDGMVGWRYGPLRVRILAQHWVRTTQLLEPGAGIVAGLSGAGLRTCYALTAPRVEVPLCAGADAAALHGRGEGALVSGRRFAEPWAAAAFDLGVEVQLNPRVSLPIRLGVVVPVLRSRVHLVRDGTRAEVFQAPAVGLRLGVGAGFRLR